MFVLGLLGSREGTQRDGLLEDSQNAHLRLQHMSAGDVLRAKLYTSGVTYEKHITSNLEARRVSLTESISTLLQMAIADLESPNCRPAFLINGELVG